MELKELLEQVAGGALSVEEAARELNQTTYEDLSYAKVDHSREVRSGFPEVVFCERKTAEQVGEIMKAIYARSGLVLGTRASVEQFEAVHHAR